MAPNIIATRFHVVVLFIFEDRGTSEDTKENFKRPKLKAAHERTMYPSMIKAAF